MSRHLEATLQALPAVYLDLLDATLPQRTSEPSDRSPDPREKPAPGNLGVIEHRHELVRGLRWWVDAVRDPGEHTQVGHDVGRMCTWLSNHLDVMAPEDLTELASNLSGWLRRAWSMLDRAPREKDEPLHARHPMGDWHREVRVADAAAYLGCTVRTIQRRVPAEQRPGGMVSLYDALPRCPRCDLRVGADCACANGVRTERAL